MKVPGSTGIALVVWNCVAPPLVVGPLNGVLSTSAGTFRVACMAPLPGWISRNVSTWTAVFPATCPGTATKLSARSAPDPSIAAAPSLLVKCVTVTVLVARAAILPTAAPIPSPASTLAAPSRSPRTPAMPTPASSGCPALWFWYIWCAAEPSAVPTATAAAAQRAGTGHSPNGSLNATGLLPA